MSAQTERKVRTANLYSDTIDQLRTIADRRNISIAEVVETYAGAAIQTEYANVVKERYQAISGRRRTAKLPPHTPELGENGAG